MKKFLLAAFIFSVMGSAGSYAQDLDRPKDKFDDFAAKVKAASRSQYENNLRVNNDVARPLGPAGNLPAPAIAPPPPPSDDLAALTSAANSGDPASMLALSNLYRTGDGVQTDLSLAYQWASMAVKIYRTKNDADGLAKAVKARISIQLPPEQRATVDQSLENWQSSSVASSVNKADDGALPQSDPFAGFIVAKSEIKAVTVYNNRAKVTRVAEVEIPAGAHTVAFTNMPTALFEDSLRAEGSAKASIKFGAITQKMFTISHDASPQQALLRQKIEELQEQKIPINAEKTAIEAQSKFLTDITQQAISGNQKLSENNLKSDQWLSAAQAIRTGMSESLKAEAQEDAKLRDIDREIQKIEARIAALHIPSSSIYSVLVPLEAETATKLAIELSYQIPNATWWPMYDARISTDKKGGLTLVQYGSVRQQTGEDWTNVSLTLSTAQPRNTAARVPVLRSVWIDARPTPKPGDGQSFIPVPIAPAENQTLTLPATPNSPQGDPLAEWRAKSEAKRVKMEQEQGPEEREAEQPAQRAVFVPAIINTGGFVSEYKIQGPSNVTSDGTDSKLLIGNFNVESTLQVHIQPQLSTEAYLVAHGKLKGDATLLPGSVNLFRDEAYVGQSNLPLLRPDEDYNLSFGTDDQVSVKHNVMKDERKQAGIISKDNFLERDFVSQLQNLHSVPVNVVLEETVPTSRDENAHVDILQEVTTPGYVADADNVKGLLNWQFKMDPKEKKDLKLGWTVSWPTDYTISGL